jgi:hypothetical protein
MDRCDRRLLRIIAAFIMSLIQKNLTLSVAIHTQKLLWSNGWDVPRMLHRYDFQVLNELHPYYNVLYNL